MRLVAVGAALIGVAASLGGCAADDTGRIGLARVDPGEAAERAIIGAAAGTAIGTGLGAIFAINPAIGAVVGAESGAAIGAAIGVATAQPLPEYAPIALPPTTQVPGFYDTWPPGSHPPPAATQVPPPRPG